ncbi:GAF domain-containing protein [Chitinophaga sp. NPDC101104]|uniref:GAF domain-containing protein n=1 Tax=Chitinophaga sp. NPDC101104 TaxID=3390561 RepID=UPI003D024DB8
MLFNLLEIQFRYPLEGFPAELLLTANVTWNTLQHCYSLDNVRLPGNAGIPVMPPVQLKKKNDQWVHTDSESGTLLSESAGAAIDEAEADKVNCLNNDCPELGYYLEKAISADGADFGNIQLFNPSYRSLSIVTQRGFRRDFLAHFNVVTAGDRSACGDALRTGQPVVIPDVSQLQSYSRHWDVAARAGYRSVISTPVTTGKRFIGMLSTHSSQPHWQWNIREHQQIAADLGLCLEARLP